MKPAARAALAVVVLILGVVLVKIFVHSSALLTPTVITPAMNAHDMLAPSLDARLLRLWQEHGGVHNAATEHKLIALTFDDGPYAETTPLLLDELHDLSVPATFFLIGRDVEEEPELTTRLIAQGYEVANHTRTHPNLDELSPREVTGELLGGSGVLARFTTATSIRSLFRPPHGRYTEDTIRTAQGLGYTTVLWSDDPGDWRAVTVDQLVTHIEEHATAPEILLLHSGQIPTIEAVAQIVPLFRSAGFEFVTVGELLRRVSSQELNHPKRTNLRSILQAQTASDPADTDTP